MQWLGVALASALVVVVTLLGVDQKEEQVPRFVLIGDSTMSEYPLSRAPLSGWGEGLRNALQGRAIVANHAVPGSSTVSFSRDYWENTLAQLKRGDFLLIQFGHNDEGVSPERRTHPWHYRHLLNRFVTESRKAGAVPVLITPIPRYQFSGGAVLDTHAPYADHMRCLASEMNVPLLDLAKLGANEMERHGEPSVRAWFMLNTDGQDTVHLTKIGAEKMAAIAERQLIQFGFLQTRLHANTH